MNFEEHAAKPLLAAVGLQTPEGRIASSVGEAAEAARDLGSVVVKAQVPAGKRGKAGGIRPADSPEAARAAAEAILGMEIGGHRVERVLVEERTPIARELYAAVLNDAATKGPLVLFSTEGGMDIEEVAAHHPETLRRCPVDIRTGFASEAAEAMVEGLDLGEAGPAVAEALCNLYEAYRRYDAELLEVNPLAVTGGGDVVALDCKFVMDDSAVPRQPDLAPLGTPEKLSELERRGKALGLRYIELDGDVGVLANGAGLTMTTMDVVRHLGGRPANFLEIGGDAYTKSEAALELVLANPGVKSLVINFCGAFARTDVMTEGIINALEALHPELPIFFSVHGTGDVEAVRMLKSRLGIQPFETMDQACRAAVEAAK